MLDVIWHRGPDDCGTHIEDGIGLGTRRLSIIDLDGGHQPMATRTDRSSSSSTARSTTTASCRRAAARGHTIATASDTETIVHLYEEQGDECVQRAAGHVRVRGLGRSGGSGSPRAGPLGHQAALLRRHGGRLVFGSEIKAILQHPAVEVHAESRRPRPVPRAEVRPGAGDDVRGNPRAAARSPAHRATPTASGSSATGISRSTVMAPASPPRRRPPSASRSCSRTRFAAISSATFPSARSSAEVSTRAWWWR